MLAPTGRAGVHAQTCRNIHISVILTLSFPARTSGEQLSKGMTGEEAGRSAALAQKPESSRVLIHKL